MLPYYPGSYAKQGSRPPLHKGGGQAGGFIPPFAKGARGIFEKGSEILRLAYEPPPLRKEEYTSLPPLENNGKILILVTERNIVMPKSSIENLLSQYLEYLEVERGRSAKTVENYHRYLRDFIAVTRMTDPKDITLDGIRKYRVALNRRQISGGHTLKRVTQNYYVIALRSFLKYLAKIGVQSLSAEQVELGKQEDREVSFLEWEEIERLLAAPEGGGITSLRDRAVLEMLFSTGLRVSELTGLDQDDISAAKEEFSVRGKGGKIRVVFLSDRAKKALTAYLEKRTDTDSALFVRLGRMKPGAQESKLQGTS